VKCAKTAEHTHTKLEMKIKFIAATSLISVTTTNTAGYAVAQLVEALCYKSEGHGFDSRWCH
jgi:hypothetical protein